MPPQQQHQLPMAVLVEIHAAAVEPSTQHQTYHILASVPRDGLSLGQEKVTRSTASACEDANGNGVWKKKGDMIKLAHAVRREAETHTGAEADYKPGASAGAGAGAGVGAGAASSLEGLPKKALKNLATAAHMYVCAF